MFGKVIPNKAELKFKEYDVYRAHYCGLCHSLKSHGFFSAMCLNYDMTFLSLVLNSLYEEGETHACSRCICHICKKHKEITDKYTPFVSDMTIFLAYYKCLDDFSDDKNIVKGLYGLYLKPKAKRILKKYPQKCASIQDNLKKLSNAEKHASLEECANLFGNILSQVFTPEDDEWKSVLSKAGFFLGKFIYVSDAYEDVASDIKKKRSNPLISIYNSPDFHHECRTILNMLAAEATQEFEKLPLVSNIEIIRNILYSGIWQSIEGAKE